MYEPQYGDYSLAELEECLHHLDVTRYPERHQRLLAEIGLRRVMGETAVDAGLNELLADDIPIGVAVLALWCFLWRMTVAGAVCLIGVRLISWANAVLNLLPPRMFSIVLTIAALLFMLAAATVIMMQVLAKRYPGYRIRIVRTAERLHPPRRFS